MVLKLVPHLPVKFGRASQSFDATRSLHRVQRCEVAKLHGQAARSSAHVMRNLHDERVAPVQLSERKLAIQVQCDQKMLPSPFHVGRSCHAAKDATPAHDLRSTNLLQLGNKTGSSRRLKSQGSAYHSAK